MLLSNPKKNQLRDKMLNSFKSKFDKTLKDVLTTLKYKNLDDMFVSTSNAQKTVEKTKFLNYIYPNILKEVLKEIGLDISDYDGSGYDFTLNGDRIELKSSLKISGFTGNKFSNKGRADYFMLIKFNLDENSMLDGVFLAIYNPSKAIESLWKSGNSKNSGFSNLSFYLSDVDDCLDIVVGDIDRGKNCKKVQKELFEKVY